MEGGVSECFDEGGREGADSLGEIDPLATLGKGLTTGGMRVCTYVIGDSQYMSENQNDFLWHIIIGKRD